MAGLRTVFNDDLGLPLIGGQVFTYDAGTSTPRDSYSDALFTTPNTNPIILDDAGSCELYLKGVYRLRVLDVNGVLIDEQDNVSQADGQFDSVLANTIAIGELQTSVANIEARNVLKTDENNKVMGYGLVASATVYASLRSDLWRVAMPTVADMGELIFTTYDTEQVVNGATVAAGAYFNPDLIARESITGDKIARGATLNKPVIVDANYSASHAQTTTNNPNTVIMPNGEMKICNDPLSAASRKVGTAVGNLVERDAALGIGNQGYVQTDATAPKIKHKKLTGFLTGSTTSVAHGVTASKLLDISISMPTAVGDRLFQGSAVEVRATSANIIISNAPSSAYPIATTPYVLLVTYEA